MKEVLSNHPNQQEIAGINPDSNATRNADIPTVLRDARGRVRWTLPGNTPEENLRLGINNVQALVIAEVPEIANFPRDENGKIREDDRKQVESLILEWIRRDRIVKKAIMSRPKISYTEQNQYFRRNIMYTLRTAFQEYGLFEDKSKKSLENLLERNRRRENTTNKPNQKVPSTIKLVDNKTSTELLVTPIDQKTGREKLIKLIRSDISIDDIDPIYITDLQEYRDKTVQLYIGRIDSSISINLNQNTYRSYIDTGALLAIPKKNLKFGYQWLEFYAVKNNTVALNDMLQSTRITDDGKFENDSWHGYEHQAFMDYMSGNLKIDDLNELPPFIAKVVYGGKAVYLGGYGTRKNSIHYEVTSGLPILNSFREVIIKLKHDPKRNYVWIEGYDVADTEQKRPLFKRRIIDLDTQGDDQEQEDKKKKKIVAWKGPQIQSIIDWAYGRLPIDDAEKATVVLNQDIKRYQLLGNLLALNIDIRDNKQIDIKEPLYLVAKEDDLYKWLEIQQDNNLNSGNNRRIISMFRLEVYEGAPKLNGNWQGPDRQAIVDYIDGKIDPKYLKRVKLKVGNTISCYIAMFKSKQLHISMSPLLKNNLLSVGDTMQVVPITNEASELILGIARENEEEILMRYKYDRKKGNFYVLDEQNEETSSQLISPEQANEELMKFLEVKD